MRAILILCLYNWFSSNDLKRIYFFNLYVKSLSGTDRLQ